MSVFQEYSAYYDLLYADKDYAGEAAFVAQLCHRFNKNAKRILDLGAGTGRHAIELARRGFVVHGVDASQTMHDRAVTARNLLSAELASRVDFSVGDARSIRSGSSFDVVTALFHVVSYQTTNTDLSSIFRTAEEHLGPNGIFLFDCWYGPAVLSTLPEPRVKVMENSDVRVIRFATPSVRLRANVVDVNYRILICRPEMGTYTEVEETHSMRYLFDPDIAFLAAARGWTIEWSGEFLTGAELSSSTWGACFLLRKTV